MKYVGYVVSLTLHLGSFLSVCWIMARFNEILLGHMLVCAAASIAGWVIGRRVRIIPPDPPESPLFIALLLLSWAGTAATVLLWYMVIPAPAEHLYRMLGVAFSLASAAWGIRLTFWSPPDRPAFIVRNAMRTVVQWRQMQAEEQERREAEAQRTWRAFEPLRHLPADGGIPLDACEHRTRIVDAIFSPAGASSQRKVEKVSSPEVIDTVFGPR